MKKLDQKGFSAIEALLMVIILLLIGFIGYYVWHSQHETNKTYSSAAKTAQSSPPRSTRKAADNTGMLVIKEWGVEAPYTGSLSLSYAVGSGTGNNSASFSSKELTDASTDCIRRGGAIARYGTDADASSIGGDGKTAAQYASTLSAGTYGHAGDYYYFFVHDQGACGNNPSATQSLQQQTNDAVKALVPKLKSVTN